MINQLILNGLIAGTIYALIALGFTIIYRTVKFFNFAHGVVYTSGAYFAYTIFNLLIKQLPSSSTIFLYFISFFLSIILTAILGVIIDRLVFFPLRKNNASNMVYLLASFGVFIFIQNLIQLIYGSQILIIGTYQIMEGYNILGAVITKNQIIIIVSSLILFIITWAFIKYSKLGKAIRAVSDDTIGARVVGINSEKIIMIAFAIGSALAGAAGILISLETNIEPTMGMNAILKGVIASVVGGIASIPGALLGGLFIGLAENVGIWKIDAGWKDVISFVILIIFLIIKPSGIMGSKNDNTKI